MKLHEIAMKVNDPKTPVCVGCGKIPGEIEEYKFNPEQMDPSEFVIEEEGTYNPHNGHFLCTECYVMAGCPSSPTGWRAP